MSNNQFRNMTMVQKLTSLRDSGLIAPSLEQRLQEARNRRNDLVNGAIPVAVTESRLLQTTVRDLWALLLDESFELTAGYTMRW